MPAAILHSGTALLLLHALSHSSVSNVIVWRQLAPLPSMIVERLLTNAVYRTTCYAYLGLLMVISGVAVYSCYDLLFSWLGTTFATLSMLVMVTPTLILTASTTFATLSASHVVGGAAQAPLIPLFTLTRSRTLTFTLIRCGRDYSSATCSPTRRSRSYSPCRRWSSSTTPSDSARASSSSSPTSSGSSDTRSH